MKTLFLFYLGNCLSLSLILLPSSSLFHQILHLYQTFLPETIVRNFSPPPIKFQMQSSDVFDNILDLSPFLHQPVWRFLDAGHHQTHDNWLHAEHPADGSPVHKVAQKIGLG